MAKILLFVLLFFYINRLSSQMLPPEQIVQKNLDYYNARDIDGFMSLMADDIKFYNFSDGKVTITGLD